MHTQPFVIERTVNAPASLVWEAITNSDRMKDWYFHIPGFKPEVGYEFSFTGGPTPEKQYLHLCQITEVIPGKRLSHSWRYEGYPGQSYVTWELREEGPQTHIRLTHTGLETFGTENPDLARGNFEAGWTEILGKMLPEYLSKM